MTTPSLDPRARKTRRSLQDALVRLIVRKGYDAVSIQDIATEADTARITFYRHYKDKEELLTDSLNTLYEDLVEQTEPVSPGGLARGYSPVTVFYHHIETHEMLYRILFTSHGAYTVLERLRHHMASHATRAIRELLPNALLAAPLEIIAHHVAAAQIGLAIWWLDNDKPYPADYMAQISLWLSLAGFICAAGLPEFAFPAPPPLNAPYPTETTLPAKLAKPLK